MDIKERAAAYEGDILRDIRRLIAIPSVEEPPKDGMPFGEGPAKALETALAIGEELGFATKKLDNYAGYIQMGEGDELMGILAHVDTVSVGAGWTHDPYAGELVDGVLYGRGVADDKGPAIIALYAMKIVKDMGIPLNKRVRLILGANEETGFRCMAHYKEVEEDLTLGFSPDADFPLIFGEKGSYGADFTAPLNGDDSIRLVSIEGGEARNVVCAKCVCVLDGGERNESVAEKFRSYAALHNMRAETEIKDKLTLTLHGVGAHASMPELGVNAISYMVDFLNGIIPQSPFVSAYAKCIGTAYDGAAMGAACSDQYGALTMNIGIVSTEDACARATIDIRYPITIEFEPYAENIKANFEHAGAEIFPRPIGAPLFVDPESELVKTLYSSYVKVTGDTENRPFTIGGGTYSKAFKNVVAFGIEFPGDINNVHMADECIGMERVLTAVQIYTEAIIGLLKI